MLYSIDNTHVPNGNYIICVIYVLCSGRHLIHHYLAAAIYTRIVGCVFNGPHIKENYLMAAL